MDMIKEVYVIFKTHLDVGFTDFSATVVEQYCNLFIPKVFEMNRADFKWTTGSWLIDTYLNNANANGIKAMEDAIVNGRITWHALPFTMHCELMDTELFEYGLSISKKLDKRFGKNTTGAKMTDVPGHTKAIVPLLAKNGVELLHLGKNEACKAPDVPGLFRWKAFNEEIIVMYDKEYGGYSEIPGTGKAVFIAHTNDNMGPPSNNELDTLRKELEEKFPGAKIIASDLTTVSNIIQEANISLPIVEGELGDTWIHGGGTDPRKLSNYRSMLRYRKELEPMQREAVNKELLLVPEHTWGLDEKNHLNDHKHFVRTEFEEVRNTLPYKKMEKSWNEQRQYILNAVETLRGAVKDLALKKLAEYKTEIPDLKDYKRIDDATASFSILDYTICFDKNGGICSLKKENLVLADNEHIWFSPLYEAFSEADYERYKSQYLVKQLDWALEDQAKIGMGSAIDKHLSAKPNLLELYCKENCVVAIMEIVGEAHEKYGAPKKMISKLVFKENQILVDFSWYEKPATRVAEAIWFGICPIKNDLLLHKLGQWVDPLSVVDYGNRSLHGVDFGVKTSLVSIETLDAALVAPGIPSLLNFDNKEPNLDKGFYFNLYNNVWGTNFPMWYDEDARFRFIVNF